MAYDVASQNEPESAYRNSIDAAVLPVLLSGSKGDLPSRTAQGLRGLPRRAVFAVLDRLGTAGAASRQQVDNPREFIEPGTYVLRCLASDGGLVKTENITFNVK